MLVSEDWAATVALALVGVIFVGFLVERWPPAVVAAAGAAAFVVLGLIDTDRLLSVFSNPAPITIGAMFVLSGALVRTGALEAVSVYVLGKAQNHPAAAVLAVVFGAMAASAFMNNTPLVMVLIPLVMRLSATLGTAASRLLIPLSYASILGGTCTLIGTSTNLLVDGVASGLGLGHFGLFEITPVGLVAAATGGLFMVFAGRFLLPDRQTFRNGDPEGREVFLTEVQVGEAFEGIGVAYGELSLFNRQGMRLLAVKRREKVVRAGVRDEPATAGDRLVLMAPPSELLTFHEEDGLQVGTRQRGFRGREEKIVEALVSPRARGHVRSLVDYNFPARFGITPLGVRRHGHIPGADLGSTRLRGADVLLLAGPPESFASLAEDEGDIVSFAETGTRSYRRRRAPVAVAALAAVVVLSAFEVMPIAALALIAAAVLMLLRCIDLDEAMESIDGGVLVLIFSMLAVGAALDATGALKLVVDALSPWFADMSPFVLLLCVYALTSALTEAVTNNAVAVILTPLAVGLAQASGLEPRAFVVAVMFAASASFATPIGYQTNTLVYAAGNYRFADFLRVGVPMNILVGVATCLAIVMVFGLH